MWTEAVMKKWLEKIKKMIKKVINTKYFSNGRFGLYILFPFRFDSRLLYALRYARKPIKPTKIVFDNYMGKGYGCNPKYVAEKLLEKYPGKFDIVWIISKEDSSRGKIPDWIRKVNYSSPAALWEFATAKVWVSNYHKISFIKKGLFKRKGQYFIQMWHGSLGIKKIENDVSCLTVDKSWLKLAKRSSKMVDYWISDSDFENEVYKRAFWNVNKILMYGHPRNDILFHNTDIAAEKVRTHFGIENKKILFYAPTFREDYRLNCYRIDFEMLKQVLQAKFGGEWAVLVRLHPRVRKYTKKILPPLPDIYNATYYTDIQELIASADCMITDYSSCIFDFMLTRRPGFIFATDIEAYNTERGFYYPLESTPFPIAKNNKELFENIENFDNEIYYQSVGEFLKSKGCIEDGQASERVADMIQELVGLDVEEIHIRQDKTSDAILNLLYNKYHKQPLQMNKIVCVNFYGKGYGCNPKYIIEELLKYQNNLDIVWLTKQGETVPDNIRAVPFHSEQAIQEIATARVLIDNVMKFTGFKKRPDQYLIQTWHTAIPFERIGYDNPYNFNNKKYRKRVESNFPDTDLLLSGNHFSSELFRKAFCYTGAIMEKGCPRNDILINIPLDLKGKLYAQYNISEDKKIILYVPMYYGKKSLVIDYQYILDQLRDNYIMLVYLHPAIRSKIFYTEGIIDVSEHLDIQELMAISDMMITDNIDLVFDFALTGKPLYFFAPDFLKYSRRSDWYFNICDIPFSISDSIDILLSQIKSENPDMSCIKLKRFKEKIGFNETGLSAKYVAVLIKKMIQGKNLDLEREVQLLNSDIISNKI